MLFARVYAAPGFTSHILVLALAFSVWGQTEPPPPSGSGFPVSPPAENANIYAGGGWGGGYHASTAAEGALQGMSSAISAQGQKNLNDSLAVGNLTAAASASIDNHVKYTQAQRWRMDTNKQRHDQEVAERRAKNASWHAKRLPKPLTTQQYNQASGTVNWPMLCRDPSYNDYRTKIDEFLGKRAKYGGLSMEEFTEVENLNTEWRRTITADRDKYPYAAVKQALQFLVSLHVDMNKQFG